MERTRKPGTLGPEEAQLVLRRAAELDRRQATVKPVLREEVEPRLEAHELERVAAESGLSREAVRRALVEFRGGALTESGTPQPLHQSIAGDEVMAEQIFDAPPEIIEERLTTTLRRNGLEVASRAPHATRWEPAPGLRSAFGRAIDLGGTAVWTGASVESGVHAVPGERTSVELRGDAKNLTAPIATVTGMMLAFPAGIALLVVLALGLRWGFSAQHAMGLLLVIASWAMLTTLISRGVARRRVKKLRRALERMLAQLVAYPGLPAPRGGSPVGSEL